MAELSRVEDPSAEAVRAIFTEPQTPHAYAQTQVGDEELRALWDLIKWAPTSLNGEPLRIVWVRTADGKSRLRPHVWAGNEGPLMSAPVTGILARDTRFHEDLPALYPFRPDLRDALEDDRAWRDRIGILSSSIQAGYLILGARALGLAPGPMEGFNRDELDAEFFPDGRFRSFLLMNTGYLAPQPEYLKRGPRRDPDDVMSWA